MDKMSIKHILSPDDDGASQAQSKDSRQLLAPTSSPIQNGKCTNKQTTMRSRLTITQATPQSQAQLLPPATPVTPLSSAKLEPTFDPLASVPLSKSLPLSVDSIASPVTKSPNDPNLSEDVRPAGEPHLSGSLSFEGAAAGVLHKSTTTTTSKAKLPSKTAHHESFATAAATQTNSPLTTNPYTPDSLRRSSRNSRKHLGSASKRSPAPERPQSSDEYSDSKASDDESPRSKHKNPAKVTKSGSKEYKSREYHFKPYCMKPNCHQDTGKHNEYRPCVLDYFGRNKNGTNKMQRWVIWCRKCYQQCSYIRNKWPETKGKLIKAQLSFIDMDEGPGNVKYTVTLRKSEQERLQNATKMGFDEYIASGKDEWAELVQAVPETLTIKGGKGKPDTEIEVDINDAKHPRFKRRHTSYYRAPISILKEISDRFCGSHKAREEVEYCVDWCVEMVKNGSISDIPRFEADPEIDRVPFSTPRAKTKSTPAIEEQTEEQSTAEEDEEDESSQDEPSPLATKTAPRAKSTSYTANPFAKSAGKRTGKASASVDESPSKRLKTE